MSKPKCGGVTRGETDVFLIGQPQASLDSGGKLPVARKILQYLKYLQSLPGMQKMPVKILVCCPLATKTHTAVCSTVPGLCRSELSSSGSQCVVAAVSEYWRKSGIPRISDFSIMKQILSLHEVWRDLSKNKSKCFEAQLE